MVNIVTEINIINTDKVDVTEMYRAANQVMNRATAKFEERLKGMNPLDEDSTDHVERSK